MLLQRGSKNCFQKVNYNINLLAVQFQCKKMCDDTQRVQYAFMLIYSAIKAYDYIGLDGNYSNCCGQHTTIFNDPPLICVCVSVSISYFLFLLCVYLSLYCPPRYLPISPTDSPTYSSPSLSPAVCYLLLLTSRNSSNLTHGRTESVYLARRVQQQHYLDTSLVRLYHLQCFWFF